ncbi:hypothetical protein CH63R_08396 [Colletotrichum higginsianum IMI 349063]|uniref:Uncharacterized protein n=1 Tax=Colletotrichum higginsianum (strain IMI 349063) TaxID=759273 RepID=A0A1B7YBY8_COLHI|nr:hypothetical protein CH63R_08396 [Colletotrichum higginsianum IMI 349063]OBR09631.1 hypothetical protein CH63R_08396 [Colletotrichum higginsianum IMI 349063]GJC96296.1 hypothetical protein ColKHC_05122 [Colletotrichum higginsianum]
MKTSIATLAILVVTALGQKTTFLCNDISNNVVQDDSICSGAGGAPLGRGSNALARSRFDIACDDKLGTVQSTGEACEA